MKTICVFCGSNTGFNRMYREKCEKLGFLFPRYGFHLVFGAGPEGLMKIVADGVFQSKGVIIGAVCRNLADKEGIYPHLTQIHLTDTLQEAKKVMMQLSDAFIALPGGIGTLDELSEILTLNQLGLMSKPCAVFNIDGYYDPFLKLLDHMIHEGFLKQTDLKHLIIETDENNLLEKIFELLGGNQ